jgi:hypothetical protein
MREQVRLVCVCNGIKMKEHSSSRLQLCLTTNCLLEIRGGAFSIGNAALPTFDPTPRKKQLMALFNVFNYDTKQRMYYHHASQHMTGDEIRQARQLKQLIISINMWQFLKY